MRSIAQIVEAVKECQEATDQELRLCIAALSGLLSMDELALRELSSSIIAGGTTVVLMKAHSIKREMNIRPKSWQMPVDRYLGPKHTPGTEENKRWLAFCKKIYQDATGEEWQGENESA